MGTLKTLTSLNKEPAQGQQNFSTKRIGTGKTMTATDVTGFCASFSAWKSGSFLHIWGNFQTDLHRKPCREMIKSTGDYSINSSGEVSPKLQISVPCRGRACPEKFGTFKNCIVVASPKAKACFWTIFPCQPCYPPPKKHILFVLFSRRL